MKKLLKLIGIAIIGVIILLVLATQDYIPKSAEEKRLIAEAERALATAQAKIETAEAQAQAEIEIAKARAKELASRVNRVGYYKRDSFRLFIISVDGDVPLDYLKKYAAGLFHTNPGITHAFFYPTGKAEVFAHHVTTASNDDDAFLLANTQGCLLWFSRVSKNKPNFVTPETVGGQCAL